MSQHSNLVGKQGSKVRAGGRAPRSLRGGNTPQDDGSARNDSARRPGGNTRSRGSRPGVDPLRNQPAGNPNEPAGPITGEGFREWSDRMRDVEELLEDPGLRAEAARIRDRAAGRAKSSSDTPKYRTGPS